MNATQFSHALGKVNDKYIMEAITYKRKKKSGWLKWGAMAACFGLILTVALTMLPGILGEARKNELPPTPDPNWQQKVVYETISFDWPIYESVDELIKACDVIVAGTVTNISFQVLDTRTGKLPEAETEELYCSLHTIYDIDVIETYKGDSKETRQIRVISGVKGAYESEQLAALGQEQATIFVLEGLTEIKKGEIYLFMLDQYDDALPTIVNPEQGVYSISDANSNGSMQIGKITVQNIILSFGTNEWTKFENIAKQDFSAEHSQALPDKDNAPTEYPSTIIIPGFDLDEPSEPNTP